MFSGIIQYALLFPEMATTLRFVCVLRAPEIEIFLIDDSVGRPHHILATILSQEGLGGSTLAQMFLEHFFMELYI